MKRQKMLQQEKKNRERKHKKSTAVQLEPEDKRDKRINTTRQQDNKTTRQTSSVTSCTR